MYFVIYIFVFICMSVVFIYFVIGYIIPTIGENVSVRGFLCAQECSFLNIYICIGYMQPTFGEYMYIFEFV